MEINRKIRNQLRLQGAGFVLLVLVVTGLLLQVAAEYNTEFDWTASGRHTLNEASIKVVEKITEPLEITSYATGDELSETRIQIRDMIKRYQKLNGRITLDFVNPRLNPQLIRDLGIRVDGEMIVKYQGRTEHLQDLSETSITNAIHRLLRSTDRQLLFITGHGERNPMGQANHDLSIFVDNLANKGFKAAPLELSKTLSVPTNASVVVIASPEVDYLPGETKVIQDYVAEGGNLLWLLEPGKAHFLKPLANDLNLITSHGIIVDLDIGLLSDDPTLVLGDYFKENPITRNFAGTQTLFPRVTGLEIRDKEGWSIKPLVKSMPRSWMELGKFEGTIRFDEGSDKAGPIVFGYTLTRDMERNGKKHQQRIIVMGDGDFLSNTYLGTQGNMAMGEAIFNWLSHDDNFIEIPPSVAPDSKVTASEAQMAILGVIFILLIPGLLVGSGFFIWLKRRKK